MNQYAENTHAQFGNARMPKELSSVANQLGIPRTLCEIYGAGGWDLRFEDMKRIGDWLEVLGVNTLNQHLSYVTIRGARKRDHPQSFSYHEPWWDAYHVSADYFARVSVALSQGEQINRVLLLEPTTTAWMYQGEPGDLDRIGDTFFKLLMALEAQQIEYDIGCEDVIESYGSVENGKLKIGQRVYDQVVLPPVIENLNAKTKSLLEKTGMSLAGPMPNRIDGVAPDNATTAAKTPDNLDQRINSIVADLKEQQRTTGLTIERTPDDQGILFHHRRTLADGELVFLVNTSIQHPSSGVVLAHRAGVESFDLYTGKISPYPHAISAGVVSAKFELPPSGSLLLFLGGKPVPGDFPHQTSTTIASVSPPEIRRLEPNVLTLDYVDVKGGGESRTNFYFYPANDFAWKKNGMDRNPWDSAVQFKDELISHKFPASSGFEVSYQFMIESAVPNDLAIVIERPDLYTITCNGKSISSRAKQWWLDKAFGRLPIASAAQSGLNIVTIRATPFTMFHEIEPAYLLGSFSLKTGAHGFVVGPDCPLQLGAVGNQVRHSITPDGTMWLSGGIGFKQGAEGRSSDDRAPYVIFDLSRPTRLSSIKIWNYNENNVSDLTSRGASKVRLTGSLKSDDDAESIDLGTFELIRANGGASEAQRLELTPHTVRYVRIDILANHNGVSYPAEGSPADNGIVGLAEVQFFAGADQHLDRAKVLRSSSELASHGRLAGHLVDGSGLTENRKGWNRQVHPFYSAGVGYREKFIVDKLKGEYRVWLPNWYGSVARVTVNGKPAGYIDAPPWECEVTRLLRRGENAVEVTVVGTLKNLLGPHHNNPGLGAAWPAAFRSAPDYGPPPGERYSTVAYGLFEPFALRQLAAQ
jgi:hypothetical protein